MVSLIVISLFSSASPEDYKAEIQSANKTSFIVRLAEGAPYILFLSLFHSDFHFFSKSFLSIIFLLTFCLVGRWGTGLAQDWLRIGTGLAQDWLRIGT